MIACEQTMTFSVLFCLVVHSGAHFQMYLGGGAVL